MADLAKQIENARRKMNIADALMGLLDQAGRLRYGVPTSVKEAMARSGSLPGAPQPDADAEEADRYASGYLFAKAHPKISKAVQPLVSRLKVSDLPLFGGATPELQSFADAGATEAERRR